MLDTPKDPQTGKPIAVLTSGGLDSAILLAELARQGRPIHPLYVRHGYFWENAELDHLRLYLRAIARPGLHLLTILQVPVTDLLPSTHWSLDGRNVPDADSPDEAVYLPGRNILLLSKAMLWCHLNRIEAVAMATLRSNPFPDASAAFFQEFERIVNQAMCGRVRSERPYADLSKHDVMLRGVGLPLSLTFSCLHPIGDRHCGRCNKCAERRRAFSDADLPDRTPYADDLAHLAASRPIHPHIPPA